MEYDRSDTFVLLWRKKSLIFHFFLQDEHDKKLEELREDMLTERVTTIQRMWRGYKQRKYFLRLRAAAILFQKVWRRIAQRRKYLKVGTVLFAIFFFLRAIFNFHRYSFSTTWLVLKSTTACLMRRDAAIILYALCSLCHCMSYEIQFRVFFPFFHAALDETWLCQVAGNDSHA